MPDRRNSQPVRLIAIDMDGTLIGSNGQVSARNREALQRAAAAGLHIAIATGRRHSYAMKILRTLDLDPSTMVLSSNGTVTRTLDGTLLHRTFLPVDTTLWLCDHLTDFRNALVLTFDLLGPDGEDAPGSLVVEEFDHLHGSIRAWMEANAPYIQRHSPIENALAPGMAPIQAMLCGTVKHMREAESLLLAHEHVMVEGHSTQERIHTARVAIHRTEYPARDLCMVDLLPAGCSKGSALRQLCQARDLPIETTLAIGDNWNDVSLFQAAGRSILMGNAPPDLQALGRTRGWQLGPTHDEDGVAQAIESLL